MPLDCGVVGAAWFQLPWDPRSSPLSIAEKEQISIILGCAIWGRTWQGHRGLCHCNNMADSRTSRHKGLMHLLRCLVFLEAHFQCDLHASYINTRANHLADDLSRNDSVSFLSKVLGASPHPTTISKQLLDLLLDPQADWVCHPWHQRFSTIFRAA
jgi:hypothetical protein